MKDGDDSLSCSTCPDTEILSAYFDKEEIPNDAILEHIHTCEECMQKIESFSTLERLIHKETAEAFDNDTANNILTGTKRKIHSVELDMPSKRNAGAGNAVLWISRIAAFFTISFLVFYLMQHNGMIRIPFTGSKVPEITTIPQNSILPQPGGIPGNINTLQLKPAGEKNSSRQFGAVDLNNIAAASIMFSPSPTNYKLNSRDGGTSMNTPVYIPSQVEHVWVIPDGDSTLIKNKIKAVLDVCSISEKNIDFSITAGNALHADIKMTRRQSIVFVKTCKGAGLKLLSSQQPQPEQSRFIGTGREPVRYVADFVGNSN